MFFAEERGDFHNLTTSHGGAPSRGGYECLKDAWCGVEVSVATDAAAARRLQRQAIEQLVDAVGVEAVKDADVDEAVAEVPAARAFLATGGGREQGAMAALAEVGAEEGEQAGAHTGAAAIGADHDQGEVRHRLPERLEAREADDGVAVGGDREQVG